MITISKTSLTTWDLFLLDTSNFVRPLVDIRCQCFTTELFSLLTTRGRHLLANAWTTPERKSHLCSKDLCSKRNILRSVEIVITFCFCFFVHVCIYLNCWAQSYNSQQYLRRGPCCDYFSTHGGFKPAVSTRCLLPPFDYWETGHVGQQLGIEMIQEVYSEIPIYCHCAFFS